MSHRFNFWNNSLLLVISGLVFFISASKDLDLALNGIGGPYSFVLWPTLAFELGVVWLALTYLKGWNSAPAKKRTVFYVLVIMIFLCLVVVKGFTNSLMKDTLDALIISFIGMYFMMLGLLMYRDHLAGTSQNQ